MALASHQITLPSLKRQCSFITSSPKKACIRSKDVFLATGAAICSSSEDELNDSDDDTSYDADQLRAKRRASTRMSMWSMDSDISRAVGQYSDDEDDNEDADSVATCIMPTRTNSVSDLQNKYNASYASTTSQSAKLKKPLLDSDRSARLRCFDYLVGSIDAAWARYCDMTAYAEEEVYRYGNIEKIPTTPASVATDDEGYKSEGSTDITDYESDYGYLTKQVATPVRRPSMLNPASNTTEEPSRCKLQNLKARLMKAKYYLQDYVESNAASDCELFWKRWDLVKYATIELVEDDDDEEIIEDTIEELEQGRIY
ncbi:hypothetical protein BABINDRAFT_7712 [Babjeviella inositovora NRRL Y-12698]|uniref:Uncharacterized protein n=1 Tax=Babjeviella inositovora NRRL Y-12698 TaxID=984486 RepID=A0A1E3QRC4_9ASCO|nr:uncharacterized protein BABINDRAFT_7712 [Babjeviella inositovora NRRL Y-12698]ODQ80253.1 hypothetical protein BABINDRAFT_7712 [Babjeviella inositovora NRRL Y-12698]